MTGKDLILKTYRHEETPRAPWVPFAGIHAGYLKGYTATEFLKNEDVMYECLMEVSRLYMPDGQPVAFDLQLEAEILGCDLIWADNNPPSVCSHPLAQTDEIPTKIPEKTEGRLPVVLNATRRLQESVGDTTAIFGLFCGPLTLASHLRGTKLYVNMKKKPEYVKALMDYVTEISLRMVDYYVEAGADVICPVDPVISQISPLHFEEHMLEPYTRLFNYIREKGKLSSFFVCGNAIANLDIMCQSGPDGISVDENIPMAAAKAIVDKHNVTIGGNIPLTTTMLFGTQQDNMKYVLDMMDSLDNHRNLVIAPGCDMPYETPIENTIAVAQVVQNPEQYRALLENYEAEDLGADVVLPDYKNLERPFVEAFTLDSISCAACTYIWAATCDMKEKFGDAIDIIEYKYSTREGIAQAKAMAVKNLPSIYLNGELLYSSIIPDADEFEAKIRALL